MDLPDSVDSEDFELLLKEWTLSGGMVVMREDVGAAYSALVLCGVRDLPKALLSGSVGLGVRGEYAASYRHFLDKGWVKDG